MKVQVIASPDSSPRAKALDGQRGDTFASHNAGFRGIVYSIRMDDGTVQHDFSERDLCKV